MASLTQTAVPPSHSHGRHDEWRRTRRWTHPLREQTVRNRSIPQGRETSMSNQRESAPRVMFFSPHPPQPAPREPAAPLHKTVRLVSWPPPSYPFKLAQSKVQLVYNSTSDLWWGEPCAQESYKISQPGREAERARVAILQEADRTAISVKLLKIKCWTDEEDWRKKLVNLRVKKKNRFITFLLNLKILLNFRELRRSVNLRRLQLGSRGEHTPSETRYVVTAQTLTDIMNKT